MKQHQTQMWAFYDYQDFRVMVIQQWHDPFGRPMVRVAVDEDMGSLSDGMTEEAFLAQAQLRTD